MLCDYPTAFERALEALALLDEQPVSEQQVSLRAQAFTTCFIVCFETGDLDQALDFSHQTVELAPAGSDPYGAARALHNRGTLLLPCTSMKRPGIACGTRWRGTRHCRNGRPMAGSHASA